MIGVILRIILPAIGIYFLIQLVREYMTGSGHDKNLDPREDQVIDVCPNCGRVSEHGHRCDSGEQG